MSERACPMGSCRKIHECNTAGCGVACGGHFCAEVVV